MSREMTPRELHAFEWMKKHERVKPVINRFGIENLSLFAEEIALLLSEYSMSEVRPRDHQCDFVCDYGRCQRPVHNDNRHSFMRGYGPIF